MMEAKQPKHFRIFLSSPGDVADERAIAQKVIDDLLYDPNLVDAVTVRVVAWDDPRGSTPLLATTTPQMAITAGMPKPSDCDIVVVILWSRMGTPLPDEYYKEDGSPYLSGTEWEFEDALHSYKESARPEILIYKREEEIQLTPSDPDFLNKYEQWQRVQKFFERCKDPHSNAIHVGYNKYKSPDDFRRLLESHLRKVIFNLMQSSEKSRELPKDSRGIGNQKQEIWSGSPFPGLRAFTEKEAPIFFGRGRETDELIKQVKNSRFVSVVGVSGSGKSSLVAAGLIPRLRNNAISTEGQSSKDWHILHFTPGKDPFNNLAGTLLLGIEKLKGDPIEYASRRTKLTNSLKESPTALSEIMQSVFVDEPHWVEVFLFIDQFEELFTLTPNDLRQPFIDMLVQSVQTSSLSTLLHGSENNKDRIRIIVTLRADFYHRCVEYPGLAEILRSGSFPLAAPSQVALHEMITRPAERAALKFDEGLAERILRDTGDEPGALALAAYTLDELYHSAKESKILSNKNYDGLGGVRGAIGRRAEAVYAKLSVDAKESLPQVFQRLVAIDHRGIATRERVDLNDIADNDAELELLNAFTEARLLVQSRGDRGAIVEVAHEALFTSWDRLAEWIETTRHDLYLLNQMRRAAILWNERGQSRDFLWLGERGEELQDALNRLHPKLNDVEMIFARSEQEHLLDELVDVATTHAMRSEIGLRLHVIGDTRKGVSLRPDGLPDITWLRVPRGEIKINDHTFNVKPFYIAKYPITYLQFQGFIDAADGYANDEWWLDFPEQFRKQKMREQIFKFSNHPRDNVSWYQAVAFSRWLTMKLPADGYPKDVLSLGTDLSARWIIRLPTEWEWQQTATEGDPSRIYPWGPDWEGGHANTQETGIFRTVAVGMYPLGASPVGAMDMGSNIREWCLNEFSNITRTETNSTRSRSLRGASFSCVKDFSQTIARHSDDPDEQPSDDGFRVVFAPEL